MMSRQDDVMVANRIGQEVGSLSRNRELDNLLRSAQVGLSLTSN